VWSGQGPDPDEWYRDWHFWRLGVVPLLFSLTGAGAVVTREVALPGTDLHYRGIAAVAVGSAMIVAGGLVFGVLVALHKRFVE
jgi:hypothetical protein